jgi:3-oxoacyl-[acyl-carrier protein] reductase
MKLAGQVAVVTGSGRGIGRATALRLARLGADVVINDVRLSSATDVGERLAGETPVQEIAALGRRSLGIEADVTSESAVRDMFRRVFEQFGRVDILVNNAGALRGACEVENCSYDAWTTEIAVNLSSQFLCAREVIRHMKERGSGRIVNISSICGVTPLQPVAAAYGAAKAGVISLTRSLALDARRSGVNVNAIVPGHIGTAIWKKNVGDASAAFVATIPVGRLGEPEDIAKAVEYLATDLSDYVTGQTLVVDGGLCSLTPF